MRVLAFTDTHGDAEAAERILAAARAAKPDVVVSAGDVTVFGKNFEPFFDKLGALRQKVYFVPGNHETREIADELASRFPYLENVAYRPLRVGRVWVGGLGADGIVPGGYENEDIFLTLSDCWKDHVNQDRPTVFLTHYPPNGTRLDGLKRHPSGKPVDLPQGDEGGSRMIRLLLESCKPDLAVCGHYHQCFGMEDRLGQTRIVNPGPSGMIVEVG